MGISDSPAKGRSFCKIVLSHFCLHDKIMIPEKFVGLYGKELDVRVYLQVPGCTPWNVGLVTDADKVWLQSGWPAFARFYSLCFGHFLVFKYQGNSRFDVSIYGKRCTEIDYPIVSTVPHVDEQGNHNLPEFTQVRKRALSNIDELKACKKTRANSACIEACHIGQCLMRKLQHHKNAENACAEALIQKLDDNIQPLDMIKPKKDELDYHNPLQQGRLYLSGSTSVEGKAKALALAKVCKSKNPSFILTVHPSYITKNGPVDIQSVFARRYMRSNQNFNVCLQVERRTWHVKCIIHQNRYRFGSGWKQFSDGNSLSIGDVCVFELVNHAQMLLEVFIYRAAKS